MKESQKKFENKITPRLEDYSQWYHDIIAAADMAEHSSVRGCMIIKPYGYALWERTQEVLNKEFKKADVENAYFPMLIPQGLLEKEEDHVEGFAPEVALVTKGGGKELEEPLALRPTSETIMYEAYSKWVESYRDLPVLINQWANVFRWETRTRMFLRTTEFLWQEGHTAHATQEQADERARQMLEVYRDFAENYAAIPVIPGRKSESEKFAGSLHTYTVEAMMQDGKALQYATSHNLGDNFAKAFDITFLDENNEQQFVWQTSWGLSTRSIGGLIMAHSDDKGLVLPPKMASIQAIIVPIYKSGPDEELVNQKAKSMKQTLEKAGVSARVDSRSNMRPGEKFFEWEKKGVPLRIEIGPRDIENNQAVFVRRDTGEKEIVGLDGFENNAVHVMELIQDNLFHVAKTREEENTKRVQEWSEFEKAINNNSFVLAHWDGTEETESKIKELTKATIRCLPFSEKDEPGVCILTGKPSQRRVLFARAY